MSVLFGINQSDELGLIHKSTTIGEAEPKIETIEVPGAIEPLDLTEFFGSVLYNERTNIFAFYVIKPRSECFEKFTEIRNLLHGQRMDVVWSEDSGYKYNGRAKVTAYMDGAVGIIEVEMLCNPYKLRVDTTRIIVSVDEEEVIELSNECMPVFPKITTTAEMRLEYEDTSTSLAAGTYYATGIMLKQGVNSIACYGTGTITFEYQEGAL